MKDSLAESENNDLRIYFYSHDKKSRDAILYQSLQDTDSPLLRKRMLGIIDKKHNQTYLYTDTSDLYRDLNNSLAWGESQRSMCLSMKILSGFMAVIGVAAVAIALVFITNPIGIGLAVGVGAVNLLVYGGLFFKAQSTKPVTFDSYCEEIKPTLIK